MLKYLKHAAGVNHEYTLAALRRIRGMDTDDVPIEGEFTTTALNWMKLIYPEKHRYVGEEALRKLVDEAKEVANSFCAKSDRSVAVLLGMMYAMGHGVTDDPLVPWVGRTLTNDSPPDPEARIKRLEGKARAYLGRVVDYFDQQVESGHV